MLPSQEILTYNIQISDSNLNICIPASGLTNPKFTIKENSLYIFLEDYKKKFFIRKLPIEVIDYIKEGRAYIIECLVYDKKLSHKIIID